MIPLGYGTADLSGAFGCGLPVKWDVGTSQAVLGGHVTIFESSKIRVWMKESRHNPGQSLLRGVLGSGWCDRVVGQTRAGPWSRPSEQGCCICTTTVSTVTSSSLSLLSSSSSYSEESWSCSERDPADMVPKE